MADERDRPTLRRRARLAAVVLVVALLWGLSARASYPVHLAGFHRAWPRTYADEGCESASRWAWMMAVAFGPEGYVLGRLTFGPGYQWGCEERR